MSAAEGRDDERFRYTDQTVELGGMTIRYLAQGDGPLVLFLHGFPEFGYSWRNQLGPIADAGYRVVAPDLRGYGGSSAPQEVEPYTYFDIIGDLVALTDHLGYEKAAVVGHDMGCYVAWNMALVLPGRVHAVAGLSVPFGSGHRCHRSPSPAAPSGLTSTS